MIGLQLSVVAAAVGALTGPKPSLDLSFFGPTLDARLTFTRATTAWYTNAAGVLTQAGINAPRFDYDPLTLQPLGLLIESQSTNQIQANTVDPVLGSWPQTPASGGTTVYSVVNDAAALTAAGLTLGTTVLKVDNTAGVGAAYISSEAAAATGGLCVASAYLRATGANAGDVRISADWASSTYAAPLVGGGAYVRRATQPTTPGPANSHRLSVEVPAGCIVYVALAQYELAQFASSYIPTYGSAATRAGETCTMSTAGWYAEHTGTWGVEFLKQPNGSIGWRVAMVDAIALVCYNYGSGSAEVRAHDSTGASATSSFTFGQVAKFALALGAAGATGMRTAIGGVSAAAAPYDGTFGQTTNPTLSVGGGDGYYLSGHLRRVTYYATPLPDASLRTLTA